MNRIKDTKSLMMFVPIEPEIGEEIALDGFRLKCVMNKTATCNKCWFWKTKRKRGCNGCFEYNCIGSWRKDRTNVRFELVKED